MAEHLRAHDSLSLALGSMIPSRKKQEKITTPKQTRLKEEEITTALGSELWHLRHWEALPRATFHKCADDSPMCPEDQAPPQIIDSNTAAAEPDCQDNGMAADTLSLPLEV